MVEANKSSANDLPHCAFRWLMHASLAAPCSCAPAEGSCPHWLSSGTNRICSVTTCWTNKQPPWLGRRNRGWAEPFIVARHRQVAQITDQTCIRSHSCSPVCRRGPGMLPVCWAGWPFVKHVDNITAKLNSVIKGWLNLFSEPTDAATHDSRLSDLPPTGSEHVLRF